MHTLCAAMGEIGLSSLTARRAPADRFKRDVPALGESPASRAVACRFCLRARFVCAHKFPTRARPHPTPPRGRKVLRTTVWFTYITLD